MNWAPYREQLPGEFSLELIFLFFEAMTMVSSALDDSGKRLIPIMPALIPQWYILH